MIKCLNCGIINADEAVACSNCEIPLVGDMAQEITLREQNIAKSPSHPTRCWNCLANLQASDAICTACGVQTGFEKDVLFTHKVIPLFKEGEDEGKTSFGS